jgi:hypothetical protein
MLPDLERIPDEFVLAPAQVASACGISIQTLRRMWDRREGPTKLQLSPRRQGSTVGSVRAYLRGLETAAA